MKQRILKLTNGFLTVVAKSLVITSCGFYIHRPEIPQELLKK